MSRAMDMGLFRVKGFPRVSGDEPYSPRMGYSASRFSPRERG